MAYRRFKSMMFQWFPIWILIPGIVGAMASPSFAQSDSSSTGSQTIGTAADHGFSVDRPADGAGGAAFADFDSLMTLIQTTIAPTAWENLGGTSSMSPYPQGIFVDPAGLVRGVEQSGPSDQLATLSASVARLGTLSERSDGSVAAAMDLDSLVRNGEQDWRLPADRRCVSLSRWMDRIQQRLDNGQPLQSDLLYTAGLSSIDYVVVIDNDVRIIGSVGGLERRGGEFYDLQSGRTPIQLPALTAAFGAAETNTPFGCTIDPTAEGLAAAASFGRQVAAAATPIGTAADGLAAALGRQSVVVFGVAGDTPLAYQMIHADRHMKEIALGIHPMPEGVPNYLDAVDTHIADGVPNDLLLRLWFTAKPIRLKVDRSGSVYELSGRPVQLSAENQLALENGQRGAIREDIRSTDFVDAFNENWSSIAAKYPIYGNIESLYTAASLAAVIKLCGPPANEIMKRAAEIRPFESLVLRTPAAVDSIAVLHTVRHGQQRHRILIASGGVSVHPKEFLTHAPEQYPAIGEVADQAESTPRYLDRWWWNL